MCMRTGAQRRKGGRQAGVWGAGEGDHAGAPRTLGQQRAPWLGSPRPASGAGVQPETEVRHRHRGGSETWLDPMSSGRRGSAGL